MGYYEKLEAVVSQLRDAKQANGTPLFEAVSIGTMPAQTSPRFPSAIALVSADDAINLLIEVLVPVRDAAKTEKRLISVAGQTCKVLGMEKLMGRFDWVTISDPMTCKTSLCRSWTYHHCILD